MGYFFQDSSTFVKKAVAH